MAQATEPIEYLIVPDARMRLASASAAIKGWLAANALGTTVTLHSSANGEAPRFSFAPPLDALLQRELARFLLLQGYEGNESTTAQPLPTAPARETDDWQCLQASGHPTPDWDVNRA